MIHKKTNGKWQRANVPTNYKINGVPHNLRKLSRVTQEEHGYFNVEIPTITEYQELIELTDSDVNNGIQRVRDFSQEEIDAYDEQQQNQVDEQAINTLESQGTQTARRLKRKVYQAIKDLTLTDNQLDNIEDFERDVYKWLSNGRIRRARRVLPITRPSGQLGVIWDIFNDEFNN